MQSWTGQIVTDAMNMETSYCDRAHLENVQKILLQRGRAGTQTSPYWPPLYCPRQRGLLLDGGPIVIRTWTPPTESERIYHICYKVATNFNYLY